MNIDVLKEAAIIIGAPILRSAGGWAVHALEDNKITRFELKKLVATIVRVGIIGAAGYFFVNGIPGLDVNTFAVAGGAIIADKLFAALKKNQNVRS